MSNNTRHGLWLIAGGYLTYNGIDLVRNVIKEKPDNYILFSVAGILFILFGIFMVVQAIKGLRKKEDNPDKQEEKEVPELPEEQAEDSKEESKLDGTEKKEETDGE